MQDLKSQLIPLLRARDRLRFDVETTTNCLSGKDPSDKMYVYFQKQLDSANSRLRMVNKSIDLLLEEFVGVDALRQPKMYKSAKEYHSVQSK